MASDQSLIAHLYRRAGFGAVPHELRVGEQMGFDGTVQHLLNGLGASDHGAATVQPPTFLPFATENSSAGSAQRQVELQQMTNWWIDLMLSTSTPLREKLTLLLHEQFPTAYSKVDEPSLLYNQNQIFRQLGPGPFDTLTTAVSKDPAMLIWLDTGTDLVAHPNENFARELMERFAMGVGNYTQTDVVEGARAFTGWSVDYATGAYQFTPSQHDYGWKVLLGHGGFLNGEEAIRIVTHTAASSRWVVSRIWSWLAYPVTPHDPIVAELVPRYAETRRLDDLLGMILNHPQFVAPASLTGLIKQPVEYVVGTLRAFQLGTDSFSSPTYVMNLLTNFGQQLFNPPTVGGWGTNQYWLSTSNSLEQLNFATQVAKLADLSAIEDESPRSRIDALTNLLGIDEFSGGTLDTLKTVRSDPAELVTLALVSPEYLAN